MMNYKPKSTYEVEKIVPSAARTVGSLRDIGYDAPRAIADLVDNSLAADATQVDVTLHFDGDRSWIRVADNGVGMDASTLLEAMRYGSERVYGSDDLGKFGFGLKTASTSQCRSVTVASRMATQNARMEVRCLNLDHIEATNEWQVLVLRGSERPDQVTEPLRSHTGTVVLWDDLDRILEYKDPWGEWARKKLLSLAEDVDLYLGMVFHRFLAGEVLGKRLTIRVNGSKVRPWDPFCRDEPKTEELPAKDLSVASDTGFGLVRVRSYVLPRQNEFSSDAAWRRASGIQNWNRQQGFYIYRANRMIQSGGWNRMRTSDEHTKLARVSLDFFPNLDALFGINIAKVYVSLPQELRDQLEPIVSQVARRADQRYRAGGLQGSGGSSRSAARRSGRGGGLGGGHRGGSDRSSADGDGSPRSGLRTKPRRAIEDAAITVGEAEALTRIVEALQERHPEVARDLGW
jgi:hypothetical protein